MQWLLLTGPAILLVLLLVSWLGPAILLVLLGVLLYFGIQPLAMTADIGAARRDASVSTAGDVSRSGATTTTSAAGQAMPTTDAHTGTD